MSDLGATLREARLSAGLSLSGQAKRTGYSRSYVGNVETGVRAVTPDVIRAYERVLGDDVRRRQLLLGSSSALAAASAPDAAVSIANDVASGRNGLLLAVQKTHATDKAVAALVAQDSASVMSLVKWSGSGKAVLRVNAAGLLAKVRSPTIDNEAVTVLHSDGDVRELYLTAVTARVISLPWDDAARVAVSGGPLPSTATEQSREVLRTIGSALAGIDAL